jgi:hypothetical protein
VEVVVEDASSESDSSESGIVHPVVPPRNNNASAHMQRGGTKNPRTHSSTATTAGRGGGIIRSATPGQQLLRRVGLGPSSTASSVTVSTGPNDHGWDYDIKLKRGLIRRIIRRYDLCFKVKSTSTDDESQATILRTLNEFFNIILQADETTIIPPYLELDRNTASINDLSSSFLASEITSFSTMKSYFSRLYSKPDGGNIYCSVILAGSIPSFELLDAVKYKLSSFDMGLWPRPTDHERVSDIGWLLYSCCQQDIVRIAEMFSENLGAIVGARWRKIITVSNARRNQTLDSPQDNSVHVRIYYIYYVIRSNAADGQRTVDG